MLSPRIGSDPQRCSAPINSVALNLVRMRESFGDQSGVEYTSVPDTYGDHSIIVLNLTLVDVVELLAAVLLADPPSPTVIVNDPFKIRIHVPNRQGGLFRIASNDVALPAAFVRVLVNLLLSGSGGCQREQNHRGAQQGEYLTDHHDLAFRRCSGCAKR